MVAEGPPRVFTIFKRVTSIGRSVANEVSIDSESVCDYHAQVVFDGRDFTVASIDPNATLRVNGKKKKRSKIFHHDKLGLGNAELIFSLYGEPVTSLEWDEKERCAQSELSGMLKLSDLSRRLLQIRAVPEQIEALLDAVIEVTHANKGL